MRPGVRTDLDRPFRREDRNAELGRPEDRAEPRDPPERDLFDSPSDSWRDLELREMLDEIESDRSSAPTHARRRMVVDR